MEMAFEMEKPGRALLKQPYHLQPCCLEEDEEVVHTAE